MAEKSGEASPSEAASTPQSEDRQAGNNWWDSWISSAKSKSAEVYSMVKKDLDEIGSAVKSEATHVFSTTSNVIGKTFKLDVPESPANVMKKSLSTFIGQVSTVLNPEPDDEDDTEVILSSGDTTMLSTYKKELEALQRVDATFIVPACGAEFDAWLASLDGDAATPQACCRRLRTSPVLREQYDRLVPDAASHQDLDLAIGAIKELEALQRVDATFIVPACGAEFDAWLASLDGDAATPQACCRRLRTSPVLREQYDRLVPDAVSHQDFWERYMFRVALLQDRLAAASRRQPADQQKITSDPVLAHLPLQADQPPLQPILQSPKKVLSGVESDVSTPTLATPSHEPSLASQADSSDVDSAVAWEDEDFANDVELTEEQQILLLEEYEKEIASKKGGKKSPRDVTNNNADTTKKSAQTRDKMNNKPIDKTKTTDKKPIDKTKTTDNKKPIDKTKSTDNKKPIDKTKATDNKKNARSPKKGKADDCGNLVEDYFGEKEVKDDASANSDESWEKEFELEDVEQKV